MIKEAVTWVLGSAPSLLSGKFLLTFTCFLNCTLVDATRQEMHVGERPSSKCLEWLLHVPQVPQTLTGRECPVSHNTPHCQACPVCPVVCSQLWTNSSAFGFWANCSVATAGACVRDCWILPDCLINYPSGWASQDLSWVLWGVDFCINILVLYTKTKEAHIALCPGKTLK